MDAATAPAFPSAEMLEFIQRMKATVPSVDFSVAAHRIRVDHAERMLVDDNYEVETLQVDGRTVEVTRPAKAATATILMFHHGALIAGSPRSLRPLARRIADRANVDVICPQYALAPEQPFPAAVHDAVRWYEWVLAREDKSDQVIVGGASAGGAVATAALVAIRDRGLPRPALGLLHCPLTDLTLTSPAQMAGGGLEPIDSRPIIRHAVDIYLNGTDPREPLASPVYADLQGLPPLHVEAAGSDRLVDDAELLTRRASEAGVAVTLHTTPGAIHNFVQYLPDSPEGAAALDRMVNAVRVSS